MKQLYKKALGLKPLNIDEGITLYNSAPLSNLMYIANTLRQIHVSGNVVGWMIDRNINLTNICYSQCSFCNFCRTPHSPDAYILSFEEYCKKIDELFSIQCIIKQSGYIPARRNQKYEFVVL